MACTTKHPMHKKFVYFGTPYVASDTLAILIGRGYVPALVITSPDAPKGRGLTLTPSETNALAVSHNIPVLTPEKITPEIVEEIKMYGAEYGICVAYGKILPQKLIEVFPLGILNIHYSLLPKYRGASPVEAALLNDEMVTGVTIQKMVRALDAGDILAQKEVAIEAVETTKDLRPRLVTIGAELLANTLPSFENGTATFTPQDASQFTHCGKIDKSEGQLDLAGNAKTNWAKYRAYAESPGTYFFAEKNGKQLRVKIITASLSKSGEFTPDRIVPEGKKEMNYADFMRGQ